MYSFSYLYGMKKCTACKLKKTIDQFGKDKSRHDGKNPRCKDCAKSIRSNQRLANPEQGKEKARQYSSKRYHDNKDEINSKRRKDRKNNPEKYKRSKESVWKRQGIKNMTQERYNQMMIDQNYSCAICHTHQDDCSTVLHVDHNHKNGKVRALLCNKCNTGIGLLNDDIDLLKKAVKYLEIYGNKS